MASSADNHSVLVLLFLFLSFALVIPQIGAEDDTSYWETRAQAAKNFTEKAFRPNPFEVIDEFNAHTHRSFHNSTRRSLKKTAHAGPCKAKNPIDQCWRCDPNWALNRKRLADCVLGFGKNAIGGKNGRYYLVTDDTDNDVQNPKPGTLRHAVIQNEPLWIIFSRNMNIKLKQELIMTSDKTIDGRGVQVRIVGGAGIMMQFVRNIIIHNIYIHNIIPKSGGLVRSSANHVGHRTESDGDGISIFGSSDIWLDHLSMRRCYDGLIDAIMGSTAITISNCRFTQQDQVMLFGASDSYTEDKKMQITVAFNRFGQAMLQRMPRVRFGFVHIVNNDYTHWRMYAIGGSSAPTIISQGNRFIGPPNDFAKEVTKRDYATENEWKHWTWRSEGDLFMNGAFFVQSGNPNHMLPSKEFSVPFQPGTMASKVTKFVGALNCVVGKPC